MSVSASPRGRFAPTPSGLLHVGNARTALGSWLSVRARGGNLVWRLEDLDPPRIVAGAADAAAEDLRWLGLDWDEGPEAGGPYAPYVQSQRSAVYEAALDRLAAAGRLFPCRYSRLEIERLVSSAPHGKEKGPPYPRELRPSELPGAWLEKLRHQGKEAEAAIRFAVAAEEVCFEDQLFGEQRERVDLAVGDFVLKRRDGLWAYQLAVVADDIAMGIDEVVRGRDLLDSTARQIQLIEALGGNRPAYLHLPLVLNAQGEKLSKRDAGLTLRALREAAIPPERLVGFLAYGLGLLECPRDLSARELLPRYDLSLLRREDFLLPSDLASVLSVSVLRRSAADLREVGGWQTTR